jgi:hypothetical protein
MSWNCDKHQMMGANCPMGFPDKCPYCYAEDLRQQLNVRCACAFDPVTGDGDPAVKACSYHMAIIGQVVRLTGELSASREMERFARLFHDEAVAERDLAWTQRDKARAAVAELIEEKDRLRKELDGVE